MAEFNILETLELVGKAKTREEKRQILTDRDNFATRALLQLNYHPDVKWHLPPGAPPYTPGQVADSTPNSLHFPWFEWCRMGACKSDHCYRIFISKAINW